MAAKQLWWWSALDSSGTRQEGVVWANNRVNALSNLSPQITCLLSMKRCPVRTSLWKTEHSSEIVRQLATLLKAGLTLSEGLVLLAQQHPIRQWQALLQTLADDLLRGTALSVALHQWPAAFPPLYQAMIRTGELTGRLDECCFLLAEQQKTQLQLTAKVKKALRYPCIMLTLAMVVVLAMVLLVLPEFAAIYRSFNTPLPALTRGVMSFADGLQHYGLWAGLAIFLPALGQTLFRHHQGWLYLRQRWLLQIPVVGLLLRGQKLSQIFTVLALTQRSGIAFLQGLESVRETQNCPYWHQVISAVHQDITQGEAIWSALRKTGEFSPLCIQLVRTGEASGALDTMLQNLANHHSERTQNQADNLATLLEPILLVVTGVIIGTLVVAMYLPIFHLGDAMSGMG